MLVAVLRFEGSKDLKIFEKIREESGINLAFAEGEAGPEGKKRKYSYWHLVEDFACYKDAKLGVEKVQKLWMQSLPGKSSEREERRPSLYMRLDDLRWISFSEYVEIAEAGIFSGESRSF